MKHKVIYWIFVALIAGCGSTDSRPLCGDVNGDGSVTSEDADMLLQHLADGVPLQRASVADVTGDGSVTALDASWILRKAADPSVIFPREREGRVKIMDCDMPELAGYVYNIGYMIFGIGFFCYAVGGQLWYVYIVRKSRRNADTL